MNEAHSLTNIHKADKALSFIQRSAIFNGYNTALWPPFSSFPLLLLVCIKPLTDALYEVESVKYIYVLLLLFAALFAKAGQCLQREVADPRNGALLTLIWSTIAYFWFHFGLLLAYGGNLSEIFKIISPFMFFVLVAYAGDKWLTHALAIGAALTIMVNAATMPFDFGWVNWGDIRTFKGYYYFKTDLAYALCFSIIIFSLYVRYKITPLLIALITLSAVQIVLANSRLNYLTFALVLLFIAAKQSVNFRSLFSYGALLSLVALIVVATYDPTKLLGFDTSNDAAFTQGRTVTWWRLLNSLADYSPVQWLFGKGAFADLRLSQEAVRGMQQANNAHNEALHLIYTQGLVGTLMYISLWVQVFRMSSGPHLPAWARGTAMFVLFIFILQSMTAVLSSFATKTWPLVMVLLAMRLLSRPPDAKSSGFPA